MEQVGGTLQGGGGRGAIQKDVMVIVLPGQQLERFPIIVKRVIHCLTSTDLGLMRILNELFRNPRYSGYLNRHEHKSL